MVKLYHIMCLCKMSDKSMTMILELLSDAFEHAKIPSSFYEAKKIITKLGSRDGCSHSSDSAKIQQMEVEMKESKAAVSVLQAQLNYFITHYMGGVLPPDFPTAAEDVVGDMESPAPARSSSNASHEPEAGPSNN